MRTIAPAAAASGFVAGLAVSHLLDPVAGRRRRARALDKLKSAGHATEDGTGVALRDLAHRSRGVLAAAVQALFPDDADDRVITERVRAALGLVASHPRALEVEVREGLVELRGPILAEEVARVLRRVGRVRGVRAVKRDGLDVHGYPDIPALQGGVRRTGPAPELLQRRWSPAARVLVTGSGVGLALAALRYPSPLAVLGAMIGLAAAARGTTNRAIGELATMSAR